MNNHPVTEIPIASASSDDLPVFDAINTQIDLGIGNFARGIITWKFEQYQDRKSIIKSLNMDENNLFFV